MGKTCVICGKPSGMYPLCREHLEMKNNGEVIKCPDCGAWHLAKEPCKCLTDSGENTELQDTVKQNGDSELTCIICGKPSNGKHFCYECWNKYREKSVDIRITHCKDTQVLDEYGNKTIKCTDGVYVRSRAESMISDWLFSKKVRIIYEPDFYYKEDGETKTLHPDFYLPDYDVYIEYCELTNKPYLKKREYTQNVYKQNNKNVLIMTNKDIDNRAQFFFEKLGIN